MYLGEKDNVVHCGRVFVQEHRGDEERRPDTSEPRYFHSKFDGTEKS